MSFKYFLILCCLMSYSANAAVEKKSGFKIGDTKQSILSETQFQSIHGPEWVKMRNQVITSSRLCKKFSICQLPNAEGRFLRDSVADAGLRSTPNDTTAKNGLANDPSIVTGIDGVLDNGTVTGTVNSTGSAHIHAGIKVYTTTAGTSSASGAYHLVGTNTVLDGSHTHGFSNGLVGTDWSQTGTANAAAQSISGDTETAPDHVVVNTFIKIN
jgi:hypothetical protein